VSFFVSLSLLFIFLFLLSLFCVSLRGRVYIDGILTLTDTWCMRGSHSERSNSISSNALRQRVLIAGVNLRKTNSPCLVSQGHAIKSQKLCNYPLTAVHQEGQPADPPEQLKWAVPPLTSLGSPFSSSPALKAARNVTLWKLGELERLKRGCGWLSCLWYALWALPESLLNTTA
jgi:hypothetical protein